MFVTANKQQLKEIWERYIDKIKNKPLFENMYKEDDKLLYMMLFTSSESKSTTTQMDEWV